MTNFKRVLSAIFAMALVLSVFTAGAYAADDTAVTNEDAGIAETAVDFTPIEYKLPLDKSTFTEYGCGPFRLAAFNCKTMSIAYCDIFSEYVYNTYDMVNGSYRDDGLVVFQQGEGDGLNGAITFKAQSTQYTNKDDNKTITLGSAVEFTAPASGTYSFSVSFYRRWGQAVVGEYYLAKNGDCSSKLGLVEIPSGSKASKTINQTVSLEKGETIWFVSKLKTDESGNIVDSAFANNATVITDFTAKLTDAEIKCTGASFNQYGLNLFWNIPENGGYTANCTVNGASVAKDASSAMFFPITPKEIFDTVKVDILDKNGTLVATKSYSVAEAAEKVIKDNSASETAKKFAQATLNLGKVAKEYFNHSGGDYTGIETAPIGPSGISLSGAVLGGQTVDGIKYSLFNVRADEKFYLRHHFTVTGNIEDYTVYVNGVEKTLTPAADDKNEPKQYYWVDVEVAAGNFGKTHKVEITDGTNTQTFDVSIYSYIKQVIDNNETDLLAVAKALYDYNVAAASPETPDASTAWLESWIGHSFDKIFVNQEPTNTKDTYEVYAAKAETEGCAIGLYSDKTTEVTLRILNAITSDVTPRVYWIKPSITVDDKAYTDAAVEITRYDTVNLTAGNNAAFLVEFTTNASTPAGDYSYEIGVYDANGSLIRVIPITLHVWNFEMPEDKTFETSMGYDYSPLDEQYALLLEHNINGARIPIGDLNETSADAYMSDPRVTAFRVVVDWELFDKESATEIERVQKIYKKLLENPEWLAKAYFYVWDEPKNSDLATLQKRCELLEKYFPEIRRTSALFLSDGTTDLAWEYKPENVSALIDSHTLHCAKLNLWDTRVSKWGTDFVTKIEAARAKGQTIWTYVCNYPAAPYLNVRLDDEGLGSRVLFWQMYQRDIEGFLYWHADYWDKNNPWVKPVGGDPKVYGDGILTYPGSDIDRPSTIPSIRLKFIRDGIDDIELMYLAESVLGENWAKDKAATVSLNLTNVNVTSDEFYELRIAIGNAIEQAMNK